MASIDDERIYLPDSPGNHLPHIFAYMHAVPMVKRKNVIDLCCGTGYGTRLLSESARAVLGLDYSEIAIDYCNSRALPNVDYNCADIEKYNFDGDIITCMQGLEHLDNPKALIAKNLDKPWIFALPYDRNDTNEHHHHRITPDLIQDWFSNKASIRYFDDSAQFVESIDFCTNFFGVYHP